MDHDVSALLNQILDEQRELRRDMGKAWGTIREIKIILQGPNGDNGINGRVKALEKDVQSIVDESVALTSKLQEYLLEGREKSCYGKAALAEYVTSLEAEEKAVNDAKDAADKATIELRKARLALIGVVVAALLGMVGTIGVAYINKAPPKLVIHSETPK